MLITVVSTGLAVLTPKRLRAVDAGAFVPEWRPLTVLTDSHQTQRHFIIQRNACRFAAGNTIRKTRLQMTARVILLLVALLSAGAQPVQEIKESRFRRTRRT